MRSLFDAAVSSAQPSICLPSHLPDPPRGKTVVVGAGKAAAAMAQAVEAHYPAALGGVVVTRYGSALPCEHIRVLEAAHPIADASSMAAAQAILQAVEQLTADDLVIALISGGGSALMALPTEGIELEAKQRFVNALMRAGAPISLLNRVRSALSKIKGGQLLNAIHPARCVSLVISDVVGDDPALIASGPTVPPAHYETSLFEEIAHYQAAVPNEFQIHLKEAANPVALPLNMHNEIRLIASPARALAATVQEVQKAGLRPILLGESIEGSPEQAAALHLAAWREAEPGSVILSGGELTCQVRGDGKGGPNLEFALELLRQANPGEQFYALACDTDGCDGNSGVAGAKLTPDSLSRCSDQALDLNEHLARSDSCGLFTALGDIIDTGPTQTNVNDFRALLKL